MDWQSSRGSRRHRVQKTPGARNPLVSVAIVLLLMVGAITLGYLISQTFLLAFLGGSSASSASSAPSTVVTSSVQSISSGSTTVASSMPVTQEAESVASSAVSISSNAATSEPFTAQLPDIEYYQVQVTSVEALENAERVMGQLHEASYVAAVVSRGGRYSVQTGIFGTRDQAQQLATALGEDYPGAWVTDWAITLYEPVQYSGEAGALRREQCAAVGELSLVVQAILEGDIPELADLKLPEASSSAEKELWQALIGDTQTWITNSEARRQSLLFEIVSNLKDVYSWFE